MTALFFPKCRFVPKKFFARKKMPAKREKFAANIDTAQKVC